MSRIIIPDTTRTICSDDERYSLNLNILDQGALSQQDEELIAALTLYRPHSHFKADDYGLLRFVPEHLKRRPRLPRVWKVRFVLTEWAFRCFQTASRLQAGQPGSVPVSTILDEMHRRIPEYDARRPILFAHGFPHGEWPNSAAWLFPESCLKKLHTRDMSMIWPEILDKSDAPFLGYDLDKIPSNFTFDLAPDLYSAGKAGRPFDVEEAQVHTMHLMGLQDMLVFPIKTNEPDRVTPIDPEHDVFDTRTIDELDAESEAIQNAYHQE